MATTPRCRFWPRARPTPADLGLCARRQAFWRAGAAGGGVLLLARPRRRDIPRRIWPSTADSPGRRLWRLWQAYTQPGRKPGSDPGGRLLGPRPAAVLRAGRSGRERASQGTGQEAGLISPWRWRRSAGSMPCSISSATSTASRRRAPGVRQELSAPLVADLEDWMRRATRQALARQRCRQGHGLHAQALDAFTRFLDDGRICLSTMPPSAPCAASLLGGNLGCSPARIAAASGPR